MVSDSPDSPDSSLAGSACPPGCSPVLHPCPVNSFLHSGGYGDPPPPLDEGSALGSVIGPICLGLDPDSGALARDHPSCVEDTRDQIKFFQGFNLHKAGYTIASVEASDNVNQLRGAAVICHVSPFGKLANIKSRVLSPLQIFWSPSNSELRAVVVESLRYA